MYSRENMKGVAESSFRLNLAILKVLGLWPFKQNSSFNRLYSYTMWIVLAGPVGVLGFIELFLGKHENGAFDATTLSVVFLSPKLLAVVINAEQIRECVAYVDNEIFLRQSQNNMDIINTCVGICRRNATVLVVGCVVGVAGWCGKVFFISGHTQLPLEVWLPFADMPVLYDCLYFDLILATTYAALSIATVDPLIAGLICHASGQVQVVKKNLKQLNEDLFQVDDTILKSRMIYKTVVECIDHYTAIVKFVEDLSRSFSVVTFFQFIHSVATICFLCLELSKIQHFGINSIILPMYLIIILVQVYVYCYYGNILIEENNTLTEAIYMSNWYEYNEQSKKALMILMECSKKPLCVTAGKILDFSLETFTLVLRRSYSLLAVLKNL